jgi:hypothetical protein
MTNDRCRIIERTVARTVKKTAGVATPKHGCRVVDHPERPITTLLRRISKTVQPVEKGVLVIRSRRQQVSLPRPAHALPSVTLSVMLPGIDTPQSDSGLAHGERSAGWIVTPSTG